MPLFQRRRNKGAAAEISEAVLGRPTRLVESDVNVNAAGTNILPNNPDRIFWEMVNNGVGEVRFSSQPGVLATGGSRLGADGGFASSSAKDDGEAVAYPQFGTPVGVACVVHVREILALAADEQ